MSYWEEAVSMTEKLEIDAPRMNVDQKIEFAKVKALIAIGQELSAINPQNLSYKDSDGNNRNGFGLRTHDEPKPDNKFVSFE